MKRETLLGLFMLAILVGCIGLFIHGAATLPVDPNCARIGDSRCVINP